MKACLREHNKNPVATVQVASAIGKRVISAKSPYSPSLRESPSLSDEVGDLHDSAEDPPGYVPSIDGANCSSG